MSHVLLNHGNVLLFCTNAETKLSWSYARNLNAAPQRESNWTQFRNFHSISCKIPTYDFHQASASFTRILGRDLFSRTVSLYKKFQGWNVWERLALSRTVRYGTLILPLFARLCSLAKEIQLSIKIVGQFQRYLQPNSDYDDGCQWRV